MELVNSIIQLLSQNKYFGWAIVLAIGAFIIFVVDEILDIIFYLFVAAAVAIGIYGVYTVFLQSALPF